MLKLLNFFQLLILVCIFPTAAKAQTGFIDHWETVVYAYDAWYYFVGTLEPNPKWRSLSFDESQWTQGVGGFGYGDDDDRTKIPKTLSVYLRRRFTISDTSKIEQAILHMDFDDAFVAYINGVEIARANIGTAGDHPAHNEPALYWREAHLYRGEVPESFITQKTVLKNFLKQGENVLAIQVHNESLNSSDLSSAAYFSVGINDSSSNYGNVPEWFKAPVSVNFTSFLPIVVINTNNNQAIPDDPRIVAHMGVIDNGNGATNRPTDSFNGYDGRIAIELRGKSSLDLFEKKSYRLETQDSFGENNNVSLMGMPEENDWILYAPYSDKTLMRNVITFQLDRNMGNYSSRTRYCELILNGSYEGIYVLMEKIKIDKNRVDIATLATKDISGDGLTGGYILRVDKPDGSGWYSTPHPVFQNARPIFFQHEDPNQNELLSVQRNYIQDFILSFESALTSPNFAHELTGYKPYINIQSFIDYFIIIELTKDVDGYRFSTYMHKDKDSKGGKLTMGPIWDFNLGYGNVDYFDPSLRVDGWIYRESSSPNLGYMYWWSRMMQDETFRNQLKCRWEMIREDILSNKYMTDYVDTLAKSLDAAQQRNFQRWDILGIYVWPNSFLGSTYREEVDWLKNWITNRLDWMDANMPGTCQNLVTGSDAETSDIKKLSVFPNPFYSQITFQYTLSQAKTVSVSVYDTHGKIIKVFYHTPQKAGVCRVLWDGTGYGEKIISKGLYFYKIQTATSVLQGKFIKL